MATPLSFQRNGQRISILNPLHEQPYYPSTDAHSEHGTLSPVNSAREDSPTPREPTRKLHQCGVCLKCFTTSGHLTRHARIHTGVKPHVCPYPGCDKDCSRLDNLIQHYRVHLPKEDRGRGNPYIRACMLDLPVPLAMPASHQGNVPVERSISPRVSRKPQHAHAHPVRRASRASSSTATDERMTLSPSTSMPPSSLVSPSDSTGTTTTVPTPMEEDAYTLASLFQRPSYAHKESFMRGM